MSALSSTLGARGSIFLSRGAQGSCRPKLELDFTLLMYRVPQNYVLNKIPAARLFFLFKPMIFWICGVIVAVAIVVSQTPKYLSVVRLY